ncbi:MAG: signal recognition particle protein Srp19 [Methanosarcinaceae archaeon]|nr:signal recognition particle protein Srp19 [Methanosarcinaceae archaeon]
MRDEGKKVIWPSYLDNKKSRKEGRRISKKKAVESPKIDEINIAANELGYAPETEYDKSYPASWWEKSGRIKIKDLKNKTKNQVIEEIAKQIQDKRDKGKSKTSEKQTKQQAQIKQQTKPVNRK